MDFYGVIGNPVGHSKSPWIHARFAALTGQSLRYDKLLAPLDGFIPSVHHFISQGGLGLNVTVPFKFEAATMATRCSERARLAQAANTLTFVDGQVWADNTDGAGLIHDIQRNAGIDLSGRRVLLLGAGGAAAGVLAPLIEAKPASITVANRTPDKADALVARHAALAQHQQVELLSLALSALNSGYDVIVNATASSLAGSASPVSARALKPGALAYDMMYGPPAQAFMDWARAHGAQARDGLGMLVEQAAASFLIWRNILPPAPQVLAELRATVD